MSWTYKALRDYDDPPDWLIEERKQQKEMMRARRLSMGQQAAEDFAAYAKRAIVALPMPWPEFFAGWRDIADKAYGQLYRSQWCIEQLDRLGYMVNGSNTSSRTRHRVIAVTGNPALTPEGYPLYKYVRGPKNDTRAIRLKLSVS